MSWRDVLEIGPECRERFVAVTKVPEAKALDIALAGVSNLAGNYQVGRVCPEDHTLIFTVEGEGVVHTDNGSQVVEKNTILSLKAEQPFLIELQANAWTTAWFDLKKTDYWNHQIRARELLEYCEYTAQIFYLLSHLYSEPNVTLRAPSLELLKSYLASTLSESGAVYPDGQRVDSLFREVERRLHYSWTVEEMSRYVHYSSPHFHRICKHRFGRSPMQQVIYLRMERAKYLLTHSQWSVGQIAGHVGYQDVFNFSRRFKKSVGQPPAAFRRNYANRLNLRTAD